MGKLTKFFYDLRVEGLQTQLCLAILSFGDHEAVIQAYF